MEIKKEEPIKNPKNGFRYSKSLIFSYNSKIKKAIDDFEDKNKKFNKSNNIDDNFSNKLSKTKNKNLLIVHKINLGQKKNQFYKQGVNDIFNEENLFFENSYQGKKVVVGKNKSNNLKPFYIINLYDKKAINNFNKQRILRANTIKNYRYKYNELSKSLKNNLKNSEFSETNNYSIASSTIDNLRKSLNMYGKRPGIYYSRNNNITDKELNSIYKKFIDREKENKLKKIKKIKINNKDNKLNEEEYDKKNNIKINNKIFNKIFKNSIDKEIKSRLNLQETILNKFQFIKKNNQKLIDKIIKNTSKIRNDILMDQLDSYRIKMENLIEQQKLKKNNNNYNQSLLWLSSLRKYQDDNLNEHDEDKIKHNSLILPTIYRNTRKINNNKEEILDNYINNFQYSFGSTSKLYSDIDSNISPLYAFILSDTLQSNEKIRNTHIDDFYKSNNINSSYGNLKLKKNLSAPSIDNKLNLKEKNSTINLNVEGKKLIKYEMEMAKQLEGKKKRLIKTKYNDDETDNKIFAKSFMTNNYYFPKSVRNTFDLH